MNKPNPWGPPERAIAREDELLRQLEATIADAERRFATPEQVDRALDRQFGHPGVRTGMMAAARRRENSK